MKTLYFLLLVILARISVPNTASAQTISSDSLIGLNANKNSVYLVVLGNGILGSVNYERLLIGKITGETVAIRVGGLFIPDRNGNNGTFLVSEISFFKGKRAVKFELGLTVYFDSEAFESNKLTNNLNIIPAARFGVRWIPTGQPYFFRVALVPLFTGDEFLLKVLL